MAITLRPPSAGQQSGRGKLGRWWATPAPSVGVTRPPSKAILPQREDTERCRSSRQLLGGVALPHWQLLAGSCDRGHGGAGLLCPVCLQPPSQPATRHPEPCARLPAASRSGAPFAIGALTPGLCQNTSQRPSLQHKSGGRVPTRQQLRALGRPHPTPEMFQTSPSSRSLQGNWGPPRCCPWLTVPLRASISQV